MPCCARQKNAGIRHPLPLHPPRSYAETPSQPPFSTPFLPAKPPSPKIALNTSSPLALPQAPVPRREGLTVAFLSQSKANKPFSKRLYSSCTLQQYQLDQIPSFQALSYVWGSSPEKDDMLYSGRALSVMQNLRAALGQLAGHEGRVTTPAGTTRGSGSIITEVVPSKALDKIK
jgi:hypothetical protein